MSTTLNDVLRDISLVIDYTSSTPSSNDSEYQRRIYFVNMAERYWAEANNYRWRELFKNDTLTTTAGQEYVTLETDVSFNNIVLGSDGTITINGRKYTVIEFTEKQKFENTGIPVAYILGNPVQGWKLYLDPTPDGAYTFDLPYYTTNLAYATGGITEKEVMTTSTDLTKCSIPRFLGFYALSHLLKNDTDPNLGVDYERQALEILKKALVAQNHSSINQSNTVEDYMEINGYRRIGR